MSIITKFDAAPMGLLDPDYRYALLRVERVIDGDTFVGVIGRDQGFYLTTQWTIHVRVHGVDCPENKGDTKLEAIAARYFTEQWLKYQPCIVETLARSPGRAEGVKTFERWVAKVYRKNGESLTDALLREGCAKPWSR